MSESLHPATLDEAPPTHAVLLHPPMTGTDANQRTSGLSCAH